MKIDMTPYIGKPFADGGRGPDAYDCWGLVVMVYRDVFGVRIPLDYDISAYATLAVTRAFQSQMENPEWFRLAYPLAPAVVAMAIHPDHPELVNHAGVYVGIGVVLHTTKPTGAILQRVDDPRIKGRIKGYYAWTGKT